MLSLFLPVPLYEVRGSLLAVSHRAGKCHSRFLELAGAHRIVELCSGTWAPGRVHGAELLGPNQLKLICCAFNRNLLVTSH